MAIDCGVTRRGVIGIGAAAVLAAPLAAAGPRDSVVRLIVGTYQGEGGGGLYPLSYDPAAESLTLGTPLPAYANASFGAYNPRHDCHYLIDEQSAGTVAAYRPGDPAWSGAMATGGADPCHIAIDQRQRRIAVAHYTAGSVAVIGVDPVSGALAGPPVVRNHIGSGPNARQRGTHVHWVGFSPDGRWLHAVDLGADAVFGYDLKSGIGQPVVSYRAPPGTGPRHMNFHPHRPQAFLLSELRSEVTVLDSAGAGRFAARQTVSTLPADFTGTNYPAEIAINRAGDRLYVSNRGHDSIAVFAVAPDGRLDPIEHVSTGGTWPRFFLLIEEAGRLLVANQRSGNVAAFAIAADGRLRATGASIAIPAPAFIARTPTTPTKG
ncbi:lactonase family protein [Sphingomonas sp. GB1N7]|uniref:lactonase family protein n=1 Tax=Parasphingomonas caseinilytica TaxID=3096158 RepID=UPI002FC8E697